MRDAILAQNQKCPSQIHPPLMDVKPALAFFKPHTIVIHRQIGLCLWTDLCNVAIISRLALFFSFSAQFAPFCCFFLIFDENA